MKVSQSLLLAGQGGSLIPRPHSLPQHDLRMSCLVLPLFSLCVWFEMYLHMLATILNTVHWLCMHTLHDLERSEIDSIQRLQVWRKLVWSIGKPTVLFQFLHYVQVVHRCGERGIIFNVFCCLQCEIHIQIELSQLTKATLRLGTKEHIV